MAPKPLTPADLRRPGLWGRPVRIYPTIQARPVPSAVPPKPAVGPQKTGVSR